MKLRGLVPNSYIHVSVRDLYIPTIAPPILLQQNRWTDHGNVYCKSLTDTLTTKQHINQMCSAAPRRCSFLASKRFQIRPTTGVLPNLVFLSSSPSKYCKQYVLVQYIEPILDRQEKSEKTCTKNCQRSC